MTARIYMVVAILGLVAAGAAQSDSLLARYVSYPDDTNKVNLLYQKGFELRNSNLPRAIEFAKACYDCADKIKNKQFLAKALNFRGILIIGDRFAQRGVGRSAKSAGSSYGNS